MVASNCCKYQLFCWRISLEVSVNVYFRIFLVDYPVFWGCVLSSICCKLFFYFTCKLCVLLFHVIHVLSVFPGSVAVNYLHCVSLCCKLRVWLQRCLSNIWIIHRFVCCAFIYFYPKDICESLSIVFFHEDIFVVNKCLCFFEDETIVLN